MPLACVLLEVLYSASFPSGSSGTFFRSGLPPGDYTLRVIARDRARREKKVIRNRLWMHGDDVYCIINLINRGWRVEGNRFTVEFNSTGVANGFLCSVDRQGHNPCKCPLL